MIIYQSEARMVTEFLPSGTDGFTISTMTCLFRTVTHSKILSSKSLTHGIHQFQDSEFTLQEPHSLIQDFCNIGNKDKTSSLANGPQSPEEHDLNKSRFYQLNSLLFFSNFDLKYGFKIIVWPIWIEICMKNFGES
jgi:hypothetical protein